MKNANHHPYPPPAAGRYWLLRVLLVILLISLTPLALFAQENPVSTATPEVTVLQQHATPDAPLKAGFGSVLLSANFRLNEGDPEETRQRADKFLQHRRTTQPVEPSLGSTFVNPPEDFAGRAT